MRRAKASPTRRHIDSRSLVAYHEAGHAILSMAINDVPRSVSIRGAGETLGRSVQNGLAGPTVLAQLSLAGFAAEHLLLRRRPRQLDRELRFALLALGDRQLAAAFAGSAEQDGYHAVQAVLRTGLLGGREISAEIERLYAAAKESLAAVWPAVQVLAAALLAREELVGDQVLEAIQSSEVFGPVTAVQEAHGLGADRAGAAIISPRRSWAAR